MVSIAANGLQPRSVGGEETPYLCMSGKSGAVTLRSQASDIIFRVKKADLDEADWEEEGLEKVNGEVPVESLPMY